MGHQIRPLAAAMAVLFAAGAAAQTANSEPRMLDAVLVRAGKLRTTPLGGADLGQGTTMSASLNTVPNGLVPL
jgi:hypothetical protein